MIQEKYVFKNIIRCNKFDNNTILTADISIFLLILITLKE